MAYRLNKMLVALKAVAEPTRLRLLEVLTHGELTVGEISTVLQQSQPRISRHLKLLCDAGLLDRFREEHWVYYRVATTGMAHDLLSHLGTLIAKDDAVLLADQKRMAEVLADRSTSAAANPHAEAPLSRVHDLLIDELANEPIGELLDIGTGTGQVLRVLGMNASRAVGIDISTEALRVARTQAHTAGLSHCLFRRGDMYALPFNDASFDTVTMDRVLADAEDPARAIHEAARTLRVGGRLCVVEAFDALAERSDNPLATLSRWCEDAQLHCERVHPVDTDAGHLLIVIARAAHASALHRAA